MKSWNKTAVIFAAMIAVMIVALPAWAVNYVTSPPLTQVVNTPVGSVTEGGQKTLHIITWGGDMGTIFANGNSPVTAPGSLFAQEGLSFKIVREDVFVKQLDAYLSGKTPYLRGTLGQIAMASELLSKDPRTKPIIVYQMTWSRGGDCLVVRGNIKDLRDLKGKTGVMQVYSPHMELLAAILNSAGLKTSDVNIKFVKDLTGTTESPAEAMRKDPTIDFCFCISPDAAALTSNGTVGTGSEQSAKGARIFFTTKMADHTIPDVYVVRGDYFASHRSEVEKFTHALLLGQEKLTELMQNSSVRKAEYDKVLASHAKILMDSDQAVADVKGLYGDCEFVGYVGNIKFFATPAYPRRLEVLSNEMQDAFIGMGLLSNKTGINYAGFDFEALKKGLVQTSTVEAPRFQVAEVAKIIDERNKQGTLADGALFSFEAFFQPNQNTFNPDLYKTQFDKIIELAATYGGAVITVEGHSDPLEYLRKKSGGAQELILNRLRQSSKNLSLTRANAVRESILAYAKTKNVVMDPSQFAVVGHGFERPKTGVVNGEPVAPKTQQEWLSNMRVEFRLIPVEAEATAFNPVGSPGK